MTQLLVVLSENNSGLKTKHEVLKEVAIAEARLNAVGVTVNRVIVNDKGILSLENPFIADADIEEIKEHLTNSVTYILSTDYDNIVIAKKRILSYKALIHRVKSGLIHELAESVKYTSLLKEQLKMLGMLDAPLFKTEAEITNRLDEQIITKALNDPYYMQELQYQNELFKGVVEVKELQKSAAKIFDAKLTVDTILSIESEEQLFSAIFNAAHDK